MSLYALFKGTGPSGFGYGSTAEAVTEGVDLNGKIFLLTGCNSGIGLETLRALGKRGAHVIAAARTEDKAKAALTETECEGTAVVCELSEPASVRSCVAAAKKRPLSGIICNAGIMALPKLAQSNGIELQFFTNHIGHFILVTELLASLTDDGRVVVVSSSAHKSAPREGIQLDNLSGEQGYSSWKAYGQSKLANLLFARHLAKRLSTTQQTANAIHPGVIATNLTRHMNPIMRGVFSGMRPLFLKSRAQGAATQTYVATAARLAQTSGQFFADCNEARSSKLGASDELAEKLWQKSEEIVSGLR